ncbi:tail fiber domain-containing protein [Winogradskyella sp. 3972H.M.0a.05]|uniref:tail fiber domain-containing protein n=1 Tax=Winogradskyella sp. 3972H.M.0a.05 TaxID=2950277 RepID=UPI00339225A7
MKRLLFSCALILLYSLSISSQVGIGNTDPKASLDITATSLTNPSNADGILIPRIDNFPSTNPTVDQDGMLIFITGNGTPTKGFYYWDNGTTNWISIVGAREINDLLDGKTDSGNSSVFLGTEAGFSDNNALNRNVGIGYQVLRSSSSGNNNSAVGYQSLTSNLVGNFNTAFGSQALRSNTNGVLNSAFGSQALSNNTTGINNLALGANSLLNNSSGDQNTAVGYRAGFSNILGNANVFLGYRAGENETGSHKLYIDNTNANANNALLYGEFDNNILRVNGELQLGSTVANRYSMPIADGTNNQVLATDGTGQLNFVDASSVFTDTNTTYDGSDFALSNQVLPLGQYVRGISATGTLISAVDQDTDDQTLNLSGTTLSIADGNSVNLSSVIDDDWTDVGPDIERQTGNVYIGNNPGTNNQLYISDDIIDWDDTNYFLDPDGDNRINEIQFDNGTIADPSIRFTDPDTGFFSPASTITAYSANGTEAFRMQNDGELSLGLTTPTQYNLSINSLSDTRQIRIGSNANNGEAIYVTHDSQQGNAVEIRMNSTFTPSSQSALSLYNVIDDVDVDIARFETGTANTYGIRSVIPITSSGGIEYGIYSDSRSANGYAGYFLGRTSLGIGTGNRYLMPETDGSNNQIMATNGLGQVSFVDASSIFTDTDDQTIDVLNLNGNTLEISLEDDGAATQTLDLSSLSGAQEINDLTDGKSDNDGTQNYSSLFLGFNAGAGDNSSDNKNVGIGYFSMNVNTVGEENTAIGYRAYESNRASQNTAVGYYALRGVNNVNSSYNTAVGHLAMGGFFVSTFAAESNVAIGASALEINAQGDFNVVVGRNAMSSSQVGSRSVAIGYNTLSSFTGSVPSVAVGYNALANYSGNSNITAIGTQSLENASDCIRCTAVGHQTLMGNTTGTDNLAVGNRVLESNTTGSWNIGIGGHSLNTISSGSQNIAIGNFAGAYHTGSNRLIIDNYTSFAEANASNAVPLIYGEFDNNILRTNGEFQVNNPSTTGYALPINDGSNNQILSTDGNGQISFVDAPSVFTDTDTDDQTIDVLSLTGTTLNISLEDDGVATQTLNLASLQDGTGNDWTTTGNAGTNPSTNFIGTTDNQDLSIRTNNVEKVRITSKGQIETTQLQSVWLGENAGNAVTVGTRNVLIGRNTGLALTTGIDNTAVGTVSLTSLVNGADNTTLGLGSLTNLTSGDGNTILGEQAAENLSSGDDNVVIGHTAGENMDGSSNIFIGTSAGRSLTGNNKLVIDNSDSSTSSFIYGEMDNEILRSNAQFEVVRNSGATISHIELTETQVNDGARIRFNNSVETNNTWLMFGRADNTASESRFNLNHTGTGNIIHIRGDGRVGINDNAPTYALELPNNTTASVGQGRANAWVTYSDGRVKQNQETLNYGLDELLKVTPKRYNQHNATFENGNLVLDANNFKNNIGFIAQELIDIIPEAVYKPKNDTEDLWSVNYESLIPVAVQAIKELNTKVEDLKHENELLKKQLKQLESIEARLSALENEGKIYTTVKVVKTN